MSVLASGNFQRLAQQAPSGVAGAALYAVEYDGAGATAQQRRLVAIDAASGAATPLHDLAAGAAARTLVATDAALFWVQTATGDNALFRQRFAPGSQAEDLLATVTNKPAGYAFATYAVYAPGSGTPLIYLLFVKGADYVLASIPLTGTPNNATTVMTGTFSVPTDTTKVTFDGLDGSQTMVVFSSGKLYFAGQALPSGFGFISEVSVATDPATEQHVLGLPNTQVWAMGFTPTRTLALTNAGGDLRLWEGSPINAGLNNGFVATLGAGTNAFTHVGADWYATDVATGTTTLNRFATAASPTAMPTTTLTPIVALTPCAGQPAQSCEAKLSTVVADATSVYFTATTGVYKYTP